MKRYRVLMPLLAATVMACGARDENSSHGTESTALVMQATDGSELILKAPSIPKTMEIGMGWATGTQSPKQPCYTGDVVVTAPTNGG